MIEEWASAVKAQPEAAVEALAALTAECKKEAARRETDAAFSDRDPLHRALFSDEPKARKNAARLMGALRNKRDSETLAKALFKEETRFVIPSILLALGACGGDAAKRAVKAYLPPAPNGISEEKHCREIAEAHRKALSSLCPKPIEKISRLDSPRRILLVAPAGFQEVLAEELKELGFQPEPHPRGAVVETADLNKLFLARCFQEALYPVAEGVKAEPGEVAAAFKAELTLPYRVELKGYPGERAEFIERFVRAAEGVNDPGHYAIEARIEIKDGLADLFIRPWNAPDQRFAYRKHALPASIHPATAAAIVRYAERYASAEEPDVLDACCGSGTLLFERELLSPCNSLLGVDLAPNAILAAKENAGAAGSEARFIQKDLRKFIPKAPVDEIFMNLPFGNRVGTHENNEGLYRALVERLPDWLKKDGFAVLYTMEYRLLTACLKREKRLVPVDERRTEAGGLLPWLFIVRRA